MDHPERIQRLLDPGYTQGLDGRPLDDLRTMKSECADVEHAVSYYRRLAQARMEILEAERGRRARGGDISELVANLPSILGAEPGRSTPTGSRVSSAQTPDVQLHWSDGREDLVADLTLANLPDLSEDDLDATTDRLRGFERDLSDVRRALHGVIDVLERQIAARQVAGTA